MILDEVCELIIDTEHKTAPNVDIGIPSIRTPNVGKGRLILDKDIKFVDEPTFVEWTKRAIPKKGDLIIAREAPVGNVAIVPDIQLCLGQRTVLARPDNQKVSPVYLCYYLLSPKMQYKMLAGSGGSTVAHLNMKDIRNLELDFLPPLPTQRKIASILSTYDDLVENNLKRIKLLEEKAAIAYSTEFGNYQVSNKEFTSLPKGWSVKTIGEIYGKLESGSRPKGGIDKELKEGIASVGAENVIGLGKYNYHSEKLITLAFFENMNRGIIEDRDILIYKDGAYIGKTTLFQDGFPHEKSCVNEHVFLLTSKDLRYQYFLFFTLNQGLYFEKMQQLNANAAQPGINQESLKSLKLIWPSENKIEEFNKEVEASVKLIFVLANQNTKLREARDILLPKLMNGQIEV